MQAVCETAVAFASRNVAAFTPNVRKVFSCVVRVMKFIFVAPVDK